MPIKIQKRLRALSLLETTREDFKKEIDKNFGGELLDLIEKGINPVKGLAGKQVQYSESYKKQIQGKATFFKKGGKTVAIEEVSNKDLKAYRASKEARAQNAKNKEFIKKRHEKFNGKKISPVNLKLTGELHRSLKIDITGENPYLEFTDKKASWHNNEGVGPNKVIRRLLPNHGGEEFTYRLFQKIMQALKNAIKKNT